MEGRGSEFDLLELDIQDFYYLLKFSDLLLLFLIKWNFIILNRIFILNNNKFIIIICVIIVQQKSLSREVEIGKLMLTRK